MEKAHSKKKAVIILTACIMLAVILWIGISLGLYGVYFGHRFDSNKALMNHVYEFEGLERNRYEFTSDKGQTLVGYMYSSGDDQRGIIVFSHGYGYGGHNSYMAAINYLAQNGYYIFAYDATGCDESEGKGIGGVPQGVIDLDHAISFVEKSGNFPDLPIGLFGHSWGGYSACNVLTYHPEIKAVIECSGPCSSTDLLEGGGKNVVGPLAYVVTPVINVYDRIRFGDYAVNTALDGFAASDAEIMVVHGTNDKIVPISYGYDIYYENYKDDPRFVFFRLDGAGHNEYLNVKSNTELFESFVAFYDENM